MARKKTKAKTKASRKRGRPAKANARRRATTRAGRRGEITTDPGTREAQAHRRHATGNSDLPIDPLGVLFGRGMIDQPQYQAGRDLGDLIEIAARRLALGGSGVSGAWLRILGVRGVSGPGAIDSAAEWAARILGRIEKRLDPAIAKLTFDVCAGAWLPFVMTVMAGDPITKPGRYAPPWAADVTKLRLGLDQVASVWSFGGGFGGGQKSKPDVDAGLDSTTITALNVHV
jgi:hypothetical protein